MSEYTGYVFEDTTTTAKPKNENSKLLYASDKGVYLLGWVCPICGRGLSPYTSMCSCKGYPDVVEVVRCNDCKHADEYYHCIFSTIWNDKNHYCGKGERRNG